MTVRLDIADGRATITLDRPDKRNALNRATVDEIHSKLDAASESGVRVVVLAAEGPVFCAGRDLSDEFFNRLAPSRLLETTFNPLVLRIAGFGVPTIAAVRGSALGAGLGLALACDIVVASTSARFGSPFGRLGGVLDSGGHFFFTERLGRAITYDLVLSGRMLDGESAARLGLVARCVDDAQLEDSVSTLAAGIAAGPTAAFRLSKQILQAGPMSLTEVTAREAIAQDAAFATVDFSEGLAAFAERRDPVFEGR